MTKSVRDVFIEAVADSLHGTPNAHHPVQFEEVLTIAGMGGLIPSIVKCTLCKSLVLTEDQDDHRKYHDNHNAVHDRIMEQAQRYVSPPTYRGR